MQPPKFRFSIRGILLVTGLLAIALAALANPNKLWMGVTYGIALLFLFGSILGVIYRTVQARAFWTGFAVFGIGYLAIIFGPLTELASKLPTTMVLEYARERMLNQTNYVPPPVTYYAPSVSVPTAATAHLHPHATTEPSDNPSDTATPPTLDSTPKEDSEEGEPTEVSVPTTYTPSYPPLFTAPYAPSYPSTGMYLPYGSESAMNFRGTGQAVCAMLFAGLGGLIAQVLFALRQA